jgi:hypothetical protein
MTAYGNRQVSVAEDNLLGLDVSSLYVLCGYTLSSADLVNIVHSTGVQETPEQHNPEEKNRIRQIQETVSSEIPAKFNRIAMHHIPEDDRIYSKIVYNAASERSGTLWHNC